MLTISEESQCSISHHRFGGKEDLERLGLGDLEGSLHRREGGSDQRLICMKCCAMVVESECLLGIKNGTRTLQNLWLPMGGSTLHWMIHSGTDSRLFGKVTSSNCIVVCKLQPIQKLNTLVVTQTLDDICRGSWGQPFRYLALFFEAKGVENRKNVKENALRRGLINHKVQLRCLSHLPYL